MHMDLTTVLREVDTWPIEERIRLVEEIWDRVVDEGGEPELTRAQWDEVDRRMAELKRHPEDVITLEEARSRLGRRR